MTNNNAKFSKLIFNHEKMPFMFKTMLIVLFQFIHITSGHRCVLGLVIGGFLFLNLGVLPSPVEAWLVYL